MCARVCKTQRERVSEIYVFGTFVRMHAFGAQNMFASNFQPFGSVYHNALVNIMRLSLNIKKKSLKKIKINK